MANEITVQSSLAYKKTGLSGISMSGNTQASQTGDKYIAGVQTIGITEEALDKGDVIAIGYLFVRNLDPTNFVDVGAAAGEYCHRLQPGGFVCGPWFGTTAFAKADTAPCKVEYAITEL